jgi:hypothetical protein
VALDPGSAAHRVWAQQASKRLGNKTLTILTITCKLPRVTIAYLAG